MMGFAALYPSYVVAWLIGFVGGDVEWRAAADGPIGGVNALANGAME
ncbi:hypothetical protein [Thiorhodococcus minor]|uniref:Uncharacterized protein n=1 Tax=Thiorhodococcus minor TaxID=57489 RepID=A0A6M0K697_9GAMM|nr:hypothetical protein [Thiorhodococcus minor]NEV65174.1 hypothetical protein [Thiorhodococcus minor]NEV65306.1 hypothetical protein [Thiorhodococcus minor]NEV65343.1 hypothetical protein [Thiorhodococcus minor]